MTIVNLILYSFLYGCIFAIFQIWLIGARAFFYSFMCKLLGVFPIPHSGTFCMWYFCLITNDWAIIIQQFSAVPFASETSIVLSCFAISLICLKCIINRCLTNDSSTPCFSFILVRSSGILRTSTFEYTLSSFSIRFSQVFESNQNTLVNKL